LGVEKNKRDILRIFQERLDQFFDEENDVYLYGRFTFVVTMKDGEIAKIDCNVNESIKV